MGLPHLPGRLPPLLDGTVDWPAVMESFEKAGYYYNDEQGLADRGALQAVEKLPEALIHPARDALDRILGRGWIESWSG